MNSKNFVNKNDSKDSNDSDLAQEPLKKSVDIQIDEYDECENSNGLGKLSISGQSNVKPQSNLLTVSSKNRMTASLNTSTSSSLSSSSSSSSSANNLNNSQHQQQLPLQSQPLPHRSEANSYNFLDNTKNESNLSSVTSTSTLILCSPSANATSTPKANSQTIPNHTSSIPIISSTSRQTSSSLLTLSNINNTNSSSTSNLANSNNPQGTNNISVLTTIDSSNNSSSQAVTRLNSNTSNTSSSNNNSSSSTIVGNLHTSNDSQIGHGHFFTKKTFHKPTFCHHCTEMLWGLIGQGFVCEGKASAFYLNKNNICLK